MCGVYALSWKLITLVNVFIFLKKSAVVVSETVPWKKVPRIYQLRLSCINEGIG